MYIIIMYFKLQKLVLGNNVPTTFAFVKVQYEILSNLEVEILTVADYAWQESIHLLPKD